MRSRSAQITLRSETCIFHKSLFNDQVVLPTLDQNGEEEQTYLVQWPQKGSDTFTLLIHNTGLGKITVYMPSYKDELATSLIVPQLISLERAVIDVLGQMWGIMLLNSIAVMFGITGLMGICAKDPTIIILVSGWPGLSTMCNHMLVCLQRATHNVNVLWLVSYCVMELTLSA